MQNIHFVMPERASHLINLLTKNLFFFDIQQNVNSLLVMNDLLRADLSFK